MYVSMMTLLVSLLAARAGNTGEAMAAGFVAAELVATLPGARLYARHGYVSTGRRNDTLSSGVSIDSVPMRRTF
jgi:hypothetical protein